jgi:hypothetical protein
MKASEIAARIIPEPMSGCHLWIGAANQQGPFFNPVWLFAMMVGCFGIYVAIVVSDDYGAPAFIFGALLAGIALLLATFASPILNHLTAPDRRAEDVGILQSRSDMISTMCRFPASSAANAGKA